MLHACAKAPTTVRPNTEQSKTDNITYPSSGARASTVVYRSRVVTVYGTDSANTKDEYIMIHYILRSSSTTYGATWGV